jgi:hypothetical protein
MLGAAILLRFRRHGPEIATRSTGTADADLAAGTHPELAALFDLMRADHDTAQGDGHWRTVLARTFDRIKQQRLIRRYGVALVNRELRPRPGGRARPARQ